MTGSLDAAATTHSLCATRSATLPTCHGESGLGGRSAGGSGSHPQGAGLLGGATSSHGGLVHGQAL
eukprot:scaffold35531_cov14-Tisochrysis_lutea.AAC.1